MKVVLFLGGMCNVANASGELVRNPNRDALGAKLRDAGYDVFDPQIDVFSHGREYDYDIDGPAEQAARAAAEVTLYEIGEGTLGGVTMLEVLNDVDKGRKVIVWFSGSFDERGRPVFAPAGFKPESITDPATKRQLGEYMKQGTTMRSNLVAFLKDAPNVAIARSESELEAAFQGFGIRI